IRHVNLWVVNRGACSGYPRLERGEVTVVLERIARGHEEPDAVEPQALEALQHHQPMAFVDGVEASSEQPDAHAGGARRQPGRRRRGLGRAQGRVCPVPPTRYLNEQSCSTPTGPRAWNLPVAIPISPPNPNSPPSANWVEALWRTMAESTSAKKRDTAAASSEMMASVWCEP